MEGKERRGERKELRERVEKDKGRERRGGGKEREGVRGSERKTKRGDKKSELTNRCWYKS